MGALSGWSGNKPGNDSGIVMSVQHAPLEGSGGMPPPRILLHTYTNFCNFPSCHTTFLYVVKSNFVYTIDQVFTGFAFLPVPPIIIITYLSAELEERPPHWSSRASIIRRTNIIEDKQVVT